MLKRAFDDALKSDKHKVKTVEYRFKLDSASSNSSSSNYVKMESVIYAMQNPFNGNIECIVAQNRICSLPLSISTNSKLHAASTQQQQQQKNVSPINQFNYQQNNSQFMSSCSSDTQSAMGGGGSSGLPGAPANLAHISMPMTPSPEEFIYSNDNNSGMNVDKYINSNNSNNNNNNNSNQMFNQAYPMQMQATTIQAPRSNNIATQNSSNQGNVHYSSNNEPNASNSNAKLIQHLHGYSPYTRVPTSTPPSASSMDMQAGNGSRNNQGLHHVNMFDMSENNFGCEIKSEYGSSNQQQQQQQNFLNPILNNYNMSQQQQQAQRHHQYINQNQNVEAAQTSTLWQLLENNNNNNNKNSNNNVKNLLPK